MSSHSPGRSGHGHWLLSSGGAEPRRIDAQAIIEKAHDLVHEGGSAALTMRLLATSLGTSTSALYRRFPSKEWLLIGVVDHVLAGVDTTPPRTGRQTARRRIEALSFSLRQVMTEHPHLHEVLTSRVTMTPSTVRIAEACFSTFHDLGVKPSLLLDAYNAWAGYVIGFTAIETKPPALAPEHDLQTVMRAQLDADEGDIPTLSRLGPDVANLAFGLRWTPGEAGAAQSSFERGLMALLDGFTKGPGR